MKNISLSIFLSGAFLGVVICDHSCIMELLDPVSPQQLFISPTFCDNVEEKFANARKNLIQCVHHKIDLSPMEILVENYCNTGSHFRRNFNRLRDCIFTNLHYMANCRYTGDMSDFNITSGIPMDICESFSENTLQCLKNLVGTPCLEKGQSVMWRMLEAVKPMATGLCLERFYAEFGSANTEDMGDEMVRTGVADSEGASTEAAGADEMVGTGVADSGGASTEAAGADETVGTGSVEPEATVGAKTASLSGSLSVSATNSAFFFWSSLFYIFFVIRLL